jgi:cytochrome c oxidase subunit III
VLLFSSLTMAWAVRCSQVEDHKGLVAMLASTLSCAMVFLGVKSIEYSHKWGMGLLPAGSFFYDPANPHPTSVQLVQVHQFSEGAAFFLTNSLYFICAPFLLLLIGVVVWLIASIAKGDAFQIACAKPLTVVCLSFFAGVGLGMVLESGDSHADEHHVAAVAHDGAAHDDHDHAEPGHEHTAVAEHAVAATADQGSDSVLEMLATDATNSGLKSELAARERQAALAIGSVVHEDDPISGGISEVQDNVLTPRKAGIFFGIYYCMTGVHAIHILGGIVVLTWLLVRAVRHDFNRQYFGPVDYVGLYWHLVDLIWIYLFPLLYLIR